ncbi:OTU domain, ubiquitin aldehyde binding [Nowakowskiella sp. JEL0407]|nr:OTU domain, ubiquitin aldehyde binding [Nowakowskiella sp. JEL0407]
MANSEESSNPYTQLSDEDILKYEKEIKSSEISKPLVSEIETFEHLIQEYASGDPIFSQKIQSLVESCIGLRTIRKDGNCFYRAFGYRFCETLQQNPQWRNVAIARVRATKDLLSSTGYDIEILQDFLEPFEDALKPDANVLQLFQTEYISDTIVCYLRLASAAELKKNRDLYEAFVLDSYPSLDLFISSQVEPMNIEADQMHLVAVANVFGVTIKVANLDASSTNDGKMNYHEISPMIPLEGTESFVVPLLYRPGHYDILKMDSGESKDWMTWEATRVDGSLEFEEESYRDIQMPPTGSVPYTEIQHHQGADVAAITFLEQLERTQLNLMPEIFGTSELLLQDEKLQHTYGTRIVSITEAMYCDTPCYFVTITTQIENSYGETLTRNVTCYVNHVLKTLAQSIIHKQIPPDGDEKRKIVYAMEFLVDERSNAVVSEVCTGTEDKSVKLDSEQLKGFLSEGAMEVFQKIISRSEISTPMRMVGWNDGELWDQAITIEKNQSRVWGKKNLIITSILFEFIKKTNDAKNPELQDFHQRFDATPNQFGKVFSMLGNDGTIFSSTNLSFQFEASPPPDQHINAVIDPLMLPGFGGNIEIASEYKECKNDIMENQKQYLSNHTDLKQIMGDYLQLLLHRKPEDVYTFTNEFFTI